MTMPAFKIGENVLFQSGITLSVSTGKNEWMEVPAALITVAKVRLVDGVWYYHDAFDTQTLYPEEAGQLFA
ncbi:hypothetical protein COW46_00670 [Candidatus Gracilibacteria bacterium CG17_big_fil_post_rev_8_21_14_2_50_48_13]|nr:MAG: hypothetical protein COW46_00670 [Candidatus Gracilibacteria bacterium CG17_big_fil_post_rev_8_21_14_2_50_48_13]